MDVEYPYAEGLARRQLLYRLPSAPSPRRLLLVSDIADSALIGGGWGGPVTVVGSQQLHSAVQQGEGCFDAVALPQLAGSGREWRQSPTGAEQLLVLAHRLLVPAGVVVGHVENMFTLRRLASVRGIVGFGGDWIRPGSIGSATRCRKVLQRAGFTDTECYYVQPSIESPMGLIPCEPKPARAHFLRAIRSARGHYSRPAYAMRVLVAWLGLGGMQQSALFFWATKAC